ncbi:MAG: Uma2 family endonuclease [Chitinophagaceae bacterium]|nr:Uma2 family endonuclease [Rubrivivax sp.]
MNALTQPKLTLEAYLAWENEQPEKHEFHRGEVYAMVGARRAHGRVVANLIRHLGNQLAGTPCQAFSDGMKVQVGDDTVLYPDVFVTCDKVDLATDLIFRSPTLVIEVLSPTTQSYDRSHKFALYRRIPVLLEYILVDPDTRRIEGFRRGADGLWVLHDMSEAPAMQAASVGCSVPLADIFAGIDPPPAS